MNASNLAIVLVLLLAVGARNAFAEEERPVVVSPLIGDTLDAKERETYVLFRSYAGFEWAVFFLAPDSMVRARVGYLRSEIMGVDTLETGFSLYALRNRIEETHRLFLDRSLKKGETDVEVRLRNGKELRGELLSVRDSSIVLATDSRLATSRPVSDWEFVSVHSFRDLESVVLPGTSMAAAGFLIGAGVGAGVGYAGDVEKPTLAEWGPSRPASASVGAILGGLLGLAIGGGTSTDDVTYSAQNYALLKPHARFDRVEPEYLTEIR